MAEAYPIEAFQGPDGALLVPEGRLLVQPGDYGKVSANLVKARNPAKKHCDEWRCQRTLDVELPVRLLRKG